MSSASWSVRPPGAEVRVWRGTAGRSFRCAAGHDVAERLSLRCIQCGARSGGDAARMVDQVLVGPHATGEPAFHHWPDPASASAAVSRVSMCA